MTVGPMTIAAVLAAVVGSYLVMKPPKLLHTNSRRVSRNVDRNASGASPTKDQLQRRRIHAAWHDSLRPRVILAPRCLRKAAKSIAHVHAWMFRVQTRINKIVELGARLQTQRDQFDGIRSTLPPGITRLLKLVIVAADIAVVASVFQTLEKGLSTIQSAFIAAASAIALTLLGSMIGNSTRPYFTKAKESGSWRLALWAVAAALFIGAGLAAIRSEQAIVGLTITSLAPVIAAAAISILGPSEAERAILRSERNLNGASLALIFPMRMLCFWLSRLSVAYTTAQTGLKRDGAQVAEMEAATLSDSELAPEAMPVTVDDLVPGASDALRAGNDLLIEATRAVRSKTSIPPSASPSGSGTPRPIGLLGALRSHKDSIHRNGSVPPKDEEAER